jgi:hypothetical protein
MRARVLDNVAELPGAPEDLLLGVESGRGAAAVSRRPQADAARSQDQVGVADKLVFSKIIARLGGR